MRLCDSCQEPVCHFDTQSAVYGFTYRRDLKSNTKSQLPASIPKSREGTAAKPWSVAVDTAKTPSCANSWR
jgi:hypothetical protein